MNNLKFPMDSSLPISKQQLIEATGCTESNADKYLEFIKGACKAFDITTKKRLSAFLSQIAHESASLSVVTENLNYSSGSLVRVWPKYFPTLEIANNYHRQPELIANRAYANRMGNGSESSGDGYKYRGRGFIQLTGKNNYKLISDYFGEDFVNNPDKLLEPMWCALSAAWFWWSNGLNELADKSDTLAISKKINGGYNGLEDRLDKYAKAEIALQNLQT